VASAGVLAAVARVLNRTAAVLGCAALAVLIGLITLQVVRRRLLGAPIAAADEVGGFLLVAMTSLGLGYAMERGDHIQVTFLTDRLPAPVLRWVRVGALLVGLGYSALLGLRTAALVLDSLRTGTFAIVSEVPLAPVQALLPVGCVLLGLQLLAQLVETLVRPR
jgi:TRAP-type C4-dicarboxylate transport system permease small subunit